MLGTNTPKNISQNISPTGTSQILSDIPAATEQVLNQEEIMMPSYIEQTDEGVFIVFEELKQPSDLQMSLDTWFGNNMYIEEFEAKNVEGILFEGVLHENRMKIGTALKAIPEDILQLFGGNIVTKNDGEGLWNFFYQPQLIQRAFENIEDTKKIQILIDILIAQAWKQNIRYGFQYEEIKKKLKDEFERRKEVKQAAGKIPMVIAKPLKETKGENAVMREVFPSKTLANNHAMNERKRLDTGHIDQREVVVGEIIYKKTPPTPGKSGMDISGLPRPGTPGADKQFSYDSKSITKVDEADGIVSLRAKISGFLYQEKDGKLEIRPTVTVEAINTKVTGGYVEAHKNAISVKDNIDDDITSALSIETGGGILGANVHSDTWVKVKENVIGNNKIHHGSKGRITIHKIGRIEAGGDIMVGRNVESAYIRSEHGVFQFGGYLTGESHVSATRVQGKKAFNSIIFGNSVILEEASDCVIVANDIHIKKVGDNVSIVYILPDISKDVDQLENDIKVIGKKLTEAKEKYKQLLISECRRIKGKSITPDDINKQHQEVVDLVPLFISSSLTKEELQRRGTYANTPMPRLIELFQELQKFQKEHEEIKNNLDSTKKLPEITKQGIKIELDTISGHVTLQEYTMSIETDIRIRHKNEEEKKKEEEKQQLFARKAHQLLWKSHPIHGNSFTLHGLK